MSGQPLRPLTLPVSRQPSTSSPNALGHSNADTSSASSSTAAIGQQQPTRSDQVLHRFYMKTVDMLAEGRVTHIGSGKVDKKKGRWFNLTIPEFTLYHPDLQIYRSISTYTAGPSQASPIPPLLVAFILDTSDVPNGQALIWNRPGGKVAIDTSLFGDKGNGNEQRTGIVLERWTLRTSAMAPSDISASQMAAHTAYRLGIIHFRALFAFARLLPAYRLFRRLRRSNNGLRLGIKLWGTEGYLNTAEDLEAAWEVMERGLIPLDTGLDKFVPNEPTPPDIIDDQQFPSVNLFGTTYSMSVDYRTDVDFTIEDMESVLSEKFVDMDEDWFTPTVARHRMEDEAKTSESKPIRKVSTPTSIPITSPIPHRQQAAAPGSFGSIGTGSRPSQSRLASVGGGGSVRIGSQGSGRWGVLAENMPFAAPSAPTDPRDASPNTSTAHSGAAIAARRLSGHSINMASSPSTSLLRSTPPIHGATPIMGTRPGASVGRTSSFLSQSGRSFTHAQLANMSPPVASASPAQSPISPSSLSFTKQPVARSLSGRATYVPHSSSSPIIPGSLEQDPAPVHATPPMQPGSGGTGPQVIKRYSSSFSRQNRLAGSHSSNEGFGGVTTPGGSGSHGGGAGSHSLLRRTSTRTSQESGLRYSATPSADDDDIQAFLKTLDTLPQPPSLAAQAVQASRSHMPSTSSSLSNQSIPASPSPLNASNNSPNSQADRPPPRAPMTKAQVDDQLKKMAGSFNLKTSRMIESASGIGESVPSRQPTPSTSGSASGAPSVGLLTASRPPSSPRRVSQPDTPPRTSLLRQGSLKAGSPLAASPSHVPLPESPAPDVRRTKQPAARSLPGTASTALAADVPLPSHTTAPPTGQISPQTTGTSTTTNESRTSSNRRGPVLLRGGFESRSTKPSSSPSHSPIRDYARLSLAPSRSNGLGNRVESMSLGYGRKTAGQRTAPSSLGVRDPELSMPGRAGGDIGEEETVRSEGRGRREGRSPDGYLSPEEDRNEQLRQGMMRDW